MLRKFSSLLLLTLLLAGFIVSPVSAEQSIATPSAQTTQSSPTWWAWLYDYTADSLSLINLNGQQMGMARPKLPNELAGNSTAEVAISRDGQYMVISAPLSNGNQGLGIYSFATRGFLATHDAGANREIRLGGTNSFSGEIQGLGTQFVSVTFVHDVYSGAPANTNTPSWSLMVYELNNGTLVDQLDSTDTNLNNILPSAKTDGYFAKIVYMDRNLDIHAQILLASAGVPTYSDAFVWNFDTGSVAQSPWTQVDIDLLPNPTGTVTQAVFPSQLSNFAVLPPMGPYDSMNAIEVGQPQSTNPAPTTEWVDGTQHHFLPQWVAGGNLIAFGTQDGAGALSYNVLAPGSQHVDPLFQPVMSVADVPDGLLAQLDNYSILYYSATNLNAPVQVHTTTSTSEMIVWTSPAGVTINYPPGGNNNSNNSNNNPPSNNSGATLVYGQTVNNIKSDCMADFYTFQGTAGDIVNIYMTRGSDDIDPYVELVAPSGLLVQFDDDGYGFPNSWIKDYSLTETGLYEIHASCLSGTGLYYLTLDAGLSSVPSVGGGAIAYGETKTGTFTDCTLDNHLWNFYGQANDTVEITAVSTTGSVDTHLMLHQDPSLYLTEDDNSLDGVNAQLVYTLPADGNYTIFATCVTGSGDYELTLNASAISQNPPTQAPSNNNPPSVIAISYGGVQFGYKDACNFPDYYTFQGTAGDIVDVTMYQTTGAIDPTLALWGPTNQLIAEDDDGAGYPNALLDDIVLPETGTYSINASCITGGGDYQLDLFLVGNNGGGNNNPPPASNSNPIQNGGTIAVGQTVFGEFTDGQCPSSYLYYFEGNAGDWINIEMWQETGDIIPSLMLYDVNLNEYRAAYGSNGYAGMYDVELRETGTYQISAQCPLGSGQFRLETWITP